MSDIHTSYYVSVHVLYTIYVGTYMYITTLEPNIFTVTTQFSLYNFLIAFIHNGENNHFSEIHYK